VIDTNPVIITYSAVVPSLVAYANVGDGWRLDKLRLASPKVPLTPARLVTVKLKIGEYLLTTTTSFPFTRRRTMATLLIRGRMHILGTRSISSSCGVGL